MVNKVNVDQKEDFIDFELKVVVFIKHFMKDLIDFVIGLVYYFYYNYNFNFVVVLVNIKKLYYFYFIYCNFLVFNFIMINNSDIKMVLNKSKKEEDVIQVVI